MAGIRFTLYLRQSERDRIQALAKEHGTSENYIIRLAIRQAVGLPTVADLLTTPAQQTPTR